MSRLVVSKICFRNILFGCFLCSVLLVLFLNRPSSLNDDVSTVLAEPRQTELMAAEFQQLERQNLLLEKCRDILTTVAANNNQTKRITPVRFRVEDRHRVLFCFVPKVASRNLVRLMLILAGAVETNDLSAVPEPKVFAENPMPILYAKTLNDTVKNGAGDFFKFLFVRHPFERLVSAYQDKLARNNDPIYHKVVSKVIVGKVRKNPSPLEMGNDVTFPEFVTFIIDEWRNGENPLDIHWRPIFDLCLPCEMQFHFIGKFETLNRDVDFLLRKLNETDLVRLFAGQPNKPKTTSSLWKESMKQISPQQLSDLNQMYADDFRLFGYPHYYNGKESLH